MKRPLAARCKPLAAGQRAGWQRAAFSLIELVISLAILSVGLVGAMRVFPIGLRASQRAEMRTRAAIVAQRTVESVKLTPWDQLIAGETSTEQSRFEIITRIAPVQPGHLADPTRLKMIEVVVRWTQDGQPRQLSFLTYVRRNTS